jgi:hypothetical protein
VICSYEGQDLLGLLIETVGYKATDARNNLYALLGLLRPGAAKLTLDYSLSAATVFTKIVIENIERTKTMPYFGMSGVGVQISTLSTLQFYLPF